MELSISVQSTRERFVETSYCSVSIIIPQNTLLVLTVHLVLLGGVDDRTHDRLGQLSPQ